MKTLSIAIREFALPVPRTGSIETHSGYGIASDGQEIHAYIQKQRLEENTNYRAEVAIKHVFEYADYQVQVGGRIDGIFDQDPPVIEEIKSTFQIQDLYKQLSTQSMNHPYCLQLQTYGYFYWLKNKTLPKLQFHLVASRSFGKTLQNSSGKFLESENLEIKLDISEYEKWLNLRLDELVKEAQAQQKRIQKRMRISKQLEFPFEHPRISQVELIKSINEAMQDRSPILVQAPTGLGKTIGTLYPVLKDALSRGQNVIYVTPKNSQHAVAESAIDKLRESGHPIRSLTITAKSKICMKNEPLCNPEYCEYAKDYYTKFEENDLNSILTRKRKFTFKTFRDLAEEYEVCPFQLQFDAIPSVETIICDYNYVFGPRNLLGNLLGNIQVRTQGDEDVKHSLPNLLIDEAHNLPFRAMDYYSPAISSLRLTKMMEEVERLPKYFQSEVKALFNDCINTVKLCQPSQCTSEERRSFKINPSIENFLDQDSALRNFLSRYLASTLEIQPKDVILRLCFYWSEFTAALKYVSEPKRPEFFTSFHPHPTGGTVKITCCDASEMLKSCYENYHQVVGFSATLKPFDYYSKLSGLQSDKLKTAEFSSPFSKANRKILIIPQISTKYADRARNYPLIADAICRIISLRPGNYFAFFPSFDFLENALAMFSPPSQFTILKQEREMKAHQVGQVLEHLSLRDHPTVVFAVQGGVFSEGVDYPGDTIIGAFVIGPSLPAFDLEREEMKAYYEKNYKSGFEYAYTYPAMSKSIQAAGRVIRTETDRGLIVLMDNRFLQPKYVQSMPKDWFEFAPSELVSKSILKDISTFWGGE